MVVAAESGLDGINAGASEATGRLKVTAPAVMAHSGLIERIVAFASAHPKVELDVSFTDVRRDLIGEGIDVAIRMGWLKDSSLKSKKLASEDRLLLAAPSYVDGLDTPTHPSDLQQWNLILLSGVGRQVGFEHHSEQSLTLTVSPRIVVDDAVALYRMVRAGAGLGALPRFLAADDLAAGRVVEVLPEWRLASLGVYAVWPPNAPRGGLTSRFVEFLVK